MKTNRDHRASRARIDSINGAESRSDGFKLLELLLVVAIGSLMVAVAVPIINTTMTNLHLGSAATGLSGESPRAGLPENRLAACRLRLETSRQDNY